MNQHRKNTTRNHREQLQRKKETVADQIYALIKRIKCGVIVTSLLSSMHGTVLNNCIMLSTQNIASKTNKLQGELEEMGVTVTVPQITKKMLSLKNHYAAEKLKTESSMKKSGASRNDVYVTKWQFLSKFDLKRTSSSKREASKSPFLQPRPRPRPFIDRVAESMEIMTHRVVLLNNYLMSTWCFSIIYVRIRTCHKKKSDYKSHFIRF